MLISRQSSTIAISYSVPQASKLLNIIRKHAQLKSLNIMFTCSYKLPHLDPQKFVQYPSTHHADTKFSPDIKTS